MLNGTAKQAGKGIGWISNYPVPFTHDFLRDNRPPTLERSFVRIWSGRAMTWA